MNDNQAKAHWLTIASKQLLGRRIVGVRYMTQSEADEYMWHSRPLIVTLDDGSWFMPSRDDEGNNGGALFTSNENEPVLPVL